MTMAKAMRNLDETIEGLMQLTDLVIESEHDGDGLPYYNEPVGAVHATKSDEEDEIERARR